MTANAILISDHPFLSFSRTAIILPVIEVLANMCGLILLLLSPLLRFGHTMD